MRPSVQRVAAALAAARARGEVRVMPDSTRTAVDAAAALGVEVGQIASSLVFARPDGVPVLVVTSGAHRVDVDRVAAHLGVERLDRVDADWVKARSGFSIGGVSPVAWEGDGTPVIIVDLALEPFDVVWAAAGHPHAVFPTSFAELVRLTGGEPAEVGA